MAQQNKTKEDAFLQGSYEVFKNLKHAFHKQFALIFNVSIAGSTITLECMYIDKPQFYYRRSELQDKYYFSLSSTRFCRSKFSIGTIMCVSLLSIVLVYLVVGEFQYKCFQQWFVFL